MRQRASIRDCLMAWVRGAVEQPTITGRTRLAPDSIQALFACDDCNFSSGQCRAGPQNFFLVVAEANPSTRFRCSRHVRFAPIVSEPSAQRFDALCQ